MWLPFFFICCRKELRGGRSVGVGVGVGWRWIRSDCYQKKCPAGPCFFCRGISTFLPGLLFFPLIGVLDLAGPANEQLLFRATQTVSGECLNPPQIVDFEKGATEGATKMRTRTRTRTRTNISQQDRVGVKLYGCSVSSLIRHHLTRMVLPEPHPQWLDRSVFAEELDTVNAESMHTSSCYDTS